MYGLGFIPERRSLSGRAGSAIRGLRYRLAADRLPDASGFPDDSPRILSQGRRNACTWFAGGQGIRHRAEALGLKLPEDLSPWFGYWYSRRDLVLRDDQVEDTGARASQIPHTARVRGCCRLRDFEVKPTDARMGPPPLVAQIRAQRLEVDIRPIYATGRELIERVCACLHHRKPVLWGGPVSRAMQANDGPTLLGPVSPVDVIGLHMMELYRYRTSNGGRRIVRGANSWGTDWRDEGRFEMEPEYLTQARSVLYVESVRLRGRATT